MGPKPWGQKILSKGDKWGLSNKDKRSLSKVLKPVKATILKKNNFFSMK